MLFKSRIKELAAQLTSSEIAEANRIAESEAGPFALITKNSRTVKALETVLARKQGTGEVKAATTPATPKEESEQGDDWSGAPLVSTISATTRAAMSMTNVHRPTAGPAPARGVTPAPTVGTQVSPASTTNGNVETVLVTAKDIMGEPVTLTRAEFDKVPHRIKGRFFQDGGKIVESGATQTAADFQEPKLLIERSEWDKLSDAKRLAFAKADGRIAQAEEEPTVTADNFRDTTNALVSRANFNKVSAKEQSAFILAGGRIVDREEAATVTDAHLRGPAEPILSREEFDKLPPGQQGKFMVNGGHVVNNAAMATHTATDFRTVQLVMKRSELAKMSALSAVKTAAFFANGGKVVDENYAGPVGKFVSTQAKVAARGAQLFAKFEALVTDDQRQAFSREFSDDIRAVATAVPSAHLVCSYMAAGKLGSGSQYRLSASELKTRGAGVTL